MFAGLCAKGPLRTIMIALAIVCAAIIQAQEPSSYHTVQAVVDGLRTPAQAQQIDHFLRAQVGIIIARTDYNTRNMMLQIQPSSGLHEQQLRGWLQALGFDARCFRRGPANAGTYVPMDPRSCVSSPQDE